MSTQITIWIKSNGSLGFTDTASVKEMPAIEGRNYPEVFKKTLFWLRENKFLGTEAKFTVHGYP